MRESFRTNEFVDDPAYQCKGKRGYSSKQKAKRAARRHNLPWLSAYRCPHCGGFHLGTKP